MMITMSSESDFVSGEPLPRPSHHRRCLSATYISSETWTNHHPEDSSKNDNNNAGSGDGPKAVNQRGTTFTSSVEPSLLTFKSSRFVHKRDRRNPEDKFQKHYKLGPVLGKGGFGTCFQCTHIASGQERAVKLLPKLKSNKGDDNDKNNHDKKAAKDHNRAILHEFKTLAQLDHPNLVKVYEMFEDKKYFFIVMDLYKGGDLFDKVQKHGPLKEEEVAIVIQRLLSCLNYCHQNGIVHRDIKPENILLTGNDFANLKLIDFGLAKRCTKDQQKQPFRSIVGSPYYVSPQVVRGCYHGGACDIWAVGVIAYVLLCGKLPFDAPTDIEVLERIQVGWVHFDDEEFDFVSPECTALIRSLLTYEEHERPTAAQALQHTWFQQQCLNHNKVKTLVVPASHYDHRSSFDVKQDVEILQKDVQDALEALQRFQSCDCKIKQATAALVACHHVPTPQRERLDAVFRVLDRDHTGCLSVYNVQLAFAYHLNVYYTQDEIMEQLWPHLNYSGSGTIGYSEFVAIVTLEGGGLGASNIDDIKTASTATTTSTVVQAVYKDLDTDGKGYLNTRDLQIGFRLEDKSDTVDLICEQMIAEVTAGTDDEVITRQLFEVAVGKSATSSDGFSSSSQQRQRPVVQRTTTTARTSLLRRFIRRSFSCSMVAIAA